MKRHARGGQAVITSARNIRRPLEQRTSFRDEVWGGGEIKNETSARWPPVIVDYLFFVRFRTWKQLDAGNELNGRARGGGDPHGPGRTDTRVMVVNYRAVYAYGRTARRYTRF